jgi:hypothetical protein
MTSDVPEDIRQYATDNGLQFDLIDLRSPVVQRMLRLRMQHPEWKAEKAQPTEKALSGEVECLAHHQVQIQRRQERDWLHWQG